MRSTKCVDTIGKSGVENGVEKFIDVIVGEEKFILERKHQVERESVASLRAKNTKI